eukprot:242820-Rhodomonas_salina.1
MTLHCICSCTRGTRVPGYPGYRGRIPKPPTANMLGFTPQKSLSTCYVWMYRYPGTRTRESEHHGDRPKRLALWQWYCSGFSATDMGVAILMGSKALA